MQSFLVSHAIYAIVLFGVLEAMCIPISSELTFLLGGAIASGGVAGTNQHPSLLLVIVVGTLAEMVGSYISYYVGRVGGKPLVHRWGRYILVTEGDVARAERFLVGRGAWALPVARMLPFVRAFASIVAGFVDIPPVRFGVLSLIGTARLRGGAVQHRLQPRRRVEQDQPQPLGGQLHPGGGRRRGDHRVRDLPAARVPQGRRRRRGAPQRRPRPTGSAARAVTRRARPVRTPRCRAGRGRGPSAWRHGRRRRPRR